MRFLRFSRPPHRERPAGSVSVSESGLLSGVVLIQLPKADSKLLVLITTACVDLMGTLMVIPLLPFYATRMGANGFGYAVLVSAFSLAALASSPLWGRFSDRYGRRPALLIALGASAISYIVFAFANSFGLLLLSRLVQGAGGGTVGVVQAYVADATEPRDRARALGWLSAATNVGVAIGPLLGSWALVVGAHPVTVAGHSIALGSSAPGLLAALISVANMYFAWRYLRESHVVQHAHGRAEPARRSLAVLARVITRSDEPSSRLIWIYAVGIGAYMGAMSMIALFLAKQFGVTKENIGYFFAYVAIVNIVARLALLGPLVDRLGEPRVSRIGIVVLSCGLALMPLSHSLPVLGIAIALIPIGASLTFPCVTAMLSQVISPDERGLYMGTQQTFGGVTRALFPLGAGFLWDHFVPGTPFWVSAAVVAGTLLLGLNLERYVPAGASVPPSQQPELVGAPAPVVEAPAGTVVPGS